MADVAAVAASTAASFVDIFPEKLTETKENCSNIYIEDAITEKIKAESALKVATTIIAEA